LEQHRHRLIEAIKAWAGNYVRQLEPEGSTVEPPR
jgi:hypothetical protein